MFNELPPKGFGASRLALTAGLLMSFLLAMTGKLQAQPASTAQKTATAPYVADASFLKDDPYRKTKQLVRLSGVRSDAELAVVRASINDVVGFARLFGITGTNLGNAVPAGTSPDEVAKIKAARVTWKAFEERSTARGRQSMPIEPASGHMVSVMDDWSVDSDSALSVRVDFRVTFFELKPVKDPAPQVLRLRFVRQGDKWLFDGATKV